MPATEWINALVWPFWKICQWELIMSACYYDYCHPYYCYWYYYYCTESLLFNPWSVWSLLKSSYSPAVGWRIQSVSIPHSEKTNQAVHCMTIKPLPFDPSPLTTTPPPLRIKQGDHVVCSMAWGGRRRGIGEGREWCLGQDNWRPLLATCILSGLLLSNIILPSGGEWCGVTVDDLTSMERERRTKFPRFSSSLLLNFLLFSYLRVFFVLFFVIHFFHIVSLPPPRSSRSPRQLFNFPSSSLRTCYYSVVGL